MLRTLATGERQRGAGGDKAGTFRALRRRNYRLYFYGQLTSMCGTWAQTVALSWLVLKVSGSGTKVGLVISVQFFPVLLLSGWGGVVADRFDNRKAVMAVQSLLGLQAAVLATVVLGGVTRMWMIYCLALVQGVGVALDTPTRQSLVSSLVPVKELSNAVSLNAGLVQLARVVGPVIAGVLIETIGIGACFVLNAASYGAIVLLVRAMDPRQLVARARLPSGRGRAMQGVRYALATPELRTLLAVAAVVGLFAGNFLVVLPLVAKYVFHGTAGTYSALAAVQGLGALVGALVVATRRHPTKLLILLASAWLGATLLVAAVAPTLALELLAVGGSGIASAVLGVSINASLQIGCRPEMRGRIISLYFLITYGSNVVGGPVTGWIAQTWNPRWSLAAGAIPTLVLAAALLVRWRNRLSEPGVAAAASVHESAARSG
jgi:MFS family permease